jgi:hypothetical protein
MAESLGFALSAVLTLVLIPGPVFWLLYFHEVLVFRLSRLAVSSLTGFVFAVSLAEFGYVLCSRRALQIVVAAGISIFPTTSLPLCN